MARIVVIGGGTGTFTVLSGLKNRGHDITAIVAMSDDGGSTGRLRTELGVLPPGDVRQCLVALSDEEKIMLDLMNYRFQEGELAGHSFGNLLLGALEKVTGSFSEAVHAASRILKIQGTVVPVTTDESTLVATLTDGTVVEGETAIDDAPPEQLRNAIVDRIALKPVPLANPDALRAIAHADVIIIGPGDFWGSIMANLCVAGIAEALDRTPAKKIFVMNLMTRWGQKGFTTKDFITALSHYAYPDIVLINSALLNETLVAAYAKDSEYPITDTLREGSDNLRIIHADLLSNQIPRQHEADTVIRSLIRHDPEKLASAICSVL